MNKLSHLIRFGLSYKAMKLIKLSYPPYQFTIEPTNKCNLKCDFCPQSDPDYSQIRPIGMLTFENFKLFLERMNKSGSANRNINFTLDGEPFLNKSFLDFIKIACENHYFPIFASNGTLLSKKTADALIEFGSFRASIDFASEKGIFESIRGRKGHFALVRKNLTYLMKQARINTNIHLDIHDISPYLDIDAKSSLERMRKLFPKNLPQRIRFDSRKFHNFCGHLEYKKNIDSYRLCPYPWIQMAITFSGDCVPCCRDTLARSRLGNLFRDDIMDIWNNNQYMQFRENLLNHRPELNAACKNCDLPYSGNDSRWNWKYALNSLLRR